MMMPSTQHAQVPGGLQHRVSNTQNVNPVSGSRPLRPNEHNEFTEYQHRKNPLPLAMLHDDEDHEALPPIREQKVESSRWRPPSSDLSQR